VNNAGYGIPGTFTASAWARHAALLQVMAGTPIHVTGRVNRTIATFARHLPQPVLVALGRRTARRYRKS
jgi:short-subunit dehydrogenase